MKENKIKKNWQQRKAKRKIKKRGTRIGGEKKRKWKLV